MQSTTANSSERIRDTTLALRVVATLATIIWAQAFVTHTNIAAAEGVRREYFEELRRRQLFDVAEGYCLRKLADERLAVADRAEYTLELSRTFAEHAKFAEAKEADDLWQRAQATVREFVSKHHDHGKIVLLEVQAALIPATQAESLRWQSELNPLDNALKKKALTLAVSVIPQLIEIESKLATLLRRSRSTDNEDALQPFEMRTLLDQVRYRIGNTLLSQSKLQETTSPDRADALLTAIEWLDKVSGAGVDAEMSMNSKLLLAEIARIQSDLKRARGVLKDINDSTPPRDIRDRAASEHVRILVQENKFTDAAEYLIGYRRKYQMMSGELRFLNAQVLLKLWQTAKQAKNEQLAEQLKQQFDVHVQRAIENHGGYWGARCRLLSESVNSSSTLGQGLAAAVQRAKQFYAAGRIDDAIDAYKSAVVKAKEEGQDKLGGDLAFIRGSILVRKSRYTLAAEAFAEHGKLFPKHQRAASAHLLWCYCLGKLYDEQATAKRREDYTAALLEHRQQFGDTATGHEATWMLARLEEKRLQITKSLEYFKQIPIDHLRGPAAQAAAARCYEMILARLRELKQSTDEWESDAIRYLAAVTSRDLTATEPLDTSRAETAVRLARIYLNQSEPQYSPAERHLRRVFSSWKAVQQKRPLEREQTWKWLLNQATQLRIVASAAQGNTRDARDLVNSLKQNSPDEILGVLDGLMPLVEGANPRTRWQLGGLQLEAASVLVTRQDELTSDQQTRLAHCLGQAYVATDQPTKALEVYEALLTDFPRDKQLIRTVAELMMKMRSQKAYKGAKQHWRTLLSSEKSGSQEWLEIRYQEALCCYKLGEFEECRKLLQVTRILYPKNGDESIRGQLTKLEADAKRRR